MSPVPYFQVSALESWSHPGTSLAVLGKPIAHSISPELHHAALAQLVAAGQTRFSTWRYFRFEIDPDNLSEALGKFHALRFQGLNLTIPHKVLATGLIASIDPAAAAIGAVNTLLWQPEGYRGFNTDGPGLSRAVRETLGRSFPGADVILLGAGGAARAAAVQALFEGCRSLLVINRSMPRLQELLDQLRRVAPPDSTTQLAGALPETLPPLPRDALLLQATPLGMGGSAETEAGALIDLDRLAGSPVVYDMVYKPAVPPLVAAAQARGWVAANGLSMLVHQAALALEHWTGQPIEPGPMALAAAVQSR